MIKIVIKRKHSLLARLAISIVISDPIVLKSTLLTIRPVRSYKEKNELVWQGIGKGDLIMTSVEKKEARIKEIVTKTLDQYPPIITSKK